MIYLPSTYNGYYIFKCKIKETARENSLEPLLKFVTADQSKSFFIEFYIEGKTLEDILPIYVYEDNDEQTVYVESYSILYVTVRKSTGRVYPDIPVDQNVGKDNINEIE